MRIAITGGTGLVGKFMVERALAEGHQVLLLGRTPPPPIWRNLGIGHVRWQLGDRPPELPVDLLVHCAFHHVPGRYRGGEGADPELFRRLNVDGTLALFEAAPHVRIAFLSSRAVYGPGPRAERPNEATPLKPDTLYGRVKAEVEAYLAPRDAVSLRATGVYGPPAPWQRHKWAELFDNFRAGRRIAPRCGTEVHGADLWQALSLAIDAGHIGPLNVSDLILDRADLLHRYAEISRMTGKLPPHAPFDPASEMDCSLLQGLGWRPKGSAGLDETLAQITAAERNL
ncbi:NAD(P)-dependent oxidoreductase [Palleronia sediminis]|uniref:NAD(P)-dependent oxidoreductase n=1 Tax=Palleronia sediminis TaxID=2547833 RepID=A0A4R6AE32_9RHOB|nr:NAD(P)-dependent oxidoreductase [Palleronia sediminis]TDL81467.1 NAD(P)-dependent oxidoreductase [Palleronia sediminis]